MPVITMGFPQPPHPSLKHKKQKDKSLRQEFTQRSQLWMRVFQAQEWLTYQQNCFSIGRHAQTPNKRSDDRAPQGRELSVREALTRIIVDWWGGKRGVGHRLQATAPILDSTGLCENALLKSFVQKRIVHGHVVALFSDFFAPVRNEDGTNPLPVTPHQGSDHLGLGRRSRSRRLPAERERRVIRERAANSAARVACASFIIFLACIRFGAPFVSARGF